MWGETTRSAARRDGASASASIEVEAELPTADVASAAAAQASDDEEQAAFRRRSAFFDEAERSFKSLMRALEEHREALLLVSESGVTVAEKLNHFFRHKDAHRTLAGSFLNAQRSARETWTGFERRYERDVISHVKNRLDEIPDVRAGIKQRANSLNEMKRLQRKTASERKLDGPFGKVKQRRLKELKDVSAVYSMHHSDVMRKFSTIERNFGNFVSPALVALVALLEEVSKYSVTALEDVRKLVSVVPPMTRELSPAPMLDAQGPHGTHTGEPPGETWDADFDLPILSPSSSPQPAVLPRSVPSESPALAADSRARSEPSGAPAIAAYAATPESVRRRVFLSADTSSLPEVLSPGNVQLGSARAPNMNGSLSQGYGDSTNAAGVPRSGSVSSNERVVDGEIGSLIGNGAGSEVSGRGIHRRHQDVRERPRRRDGMGSTDTVPSESGAARPEVLMRLRVLYDFSPREMNEIELRKGDVVEVGEKTDSGWWYGRCRRRAGLFPENYTRELTDEEEREFVSDRRRRRERRQGHRRRDSKESKKSGKSASGAPPALLQP